MPSTCHPGPSVIVVPDPTSTFSTTLRANPFACAVSPYFFLLSPPIENWPLLPVRTRVRPVTSSVEKGMKFPCPRIGYA